MQKSAVHITCMLLRLCYQGQDHQVSMWCPVVESFQDVFPFLKHSTFSSPSTRELIHKCHLLFLPSFRLMNLFFSDMFSSDFQHFQAFIYKSENCSFSHILSPPPKNAKRKQSRKKRQKINTVCLKSCTRQKYAYITRHRKSVNTLFRNVFPKCSQIITGR